MNLKTFVEAVRAPFFTGVIVPVILGSVLAWHSGADFHWGYFILTLIGIVCIHGGANTINDYFDHKSSNDELNTEFVRPFTGGSRMIQKGILTAAGTLRLSLSLYGIGIIIGLFLAYTRGLPILWMGIAGVAIGVFYVMPGINLAARGIGEIGIFVAFGLLCTVGAFYVQAQQISVEAILLSTPVALLITAVLWINEFPDFNADKAVGKNHLVVRLGKLKSAIVYSGIMILTYVLITLFALIYNLWLLIALLMLPLAIKISRNAIVNYANTEVLIPSNAGTIMSHMITGILLSGGYILDKLI